MCLVNKLYNNIIILETGCGEEGGGASSCMPQSCHTEMMLLTCTCVFAGNGNKLHTYVNIDTFSLPHPPSFSYGTSMCGDGANDCGVSY